MAEDWSADVKRYDPDAPDGVIAGIVRYCGIALQKRDSSLVSFQDPAETGRVRENFLKKKLGLTHTDTELDKAIAGVGERMKGDSFKNRVTVYYLLTRLFGRETVFDKGYAAGPNVAALGAAGVGAAGVGAAALAGLDPTPSAEPAVAATVEPGPVDTTPSYVAAGPVEEERDGGLGWLWWLLGLLVLGLLLWWLFMGDAKEVAPAAPVATETVAVTDASGDTVDFTVAPVEGSVAIPEGAGVTSELRSGKPVVKVYFDTAKTELAPAFAPAATALKAWLDANPGTSLAISGFNDPTGNAAANAELAKNRAGAVRAALVGAGVDESRTELVKPADATDEETNLAAARRVEVVVR